MSRAVLSAPVAILRGNGGPEIRNLNTDTAIDPSLGLPVEEVRWEGAVLDRIKDYCNALSLAIALPRTRVSHFVAPVAVTVFDASSDINVVDTLIRRVRGEINLKGFIGFRSLTRAGDQATLKVVLIDAHRHSDE